MVCRRLPLSGRPTYTTSETPSPDTRRSRHFVLSTSNSHPPSKAPGNPPPFHHLIQDQNEPPLIALSVPNAPSESLEKKRNFSSRTLPPRRPKRASPKKDRERKRKKERDTGPRGRSGSVPQTVAPLPPQPQLRLSTDRSPTASASLPLLGRS